MKKNVVFDYPGLNSWSDAKMTWRADILICNDTIQVICAVHKGFEEMEKNVDIP